MEVAQTVTIEAGEFISPISSETIQKAEDGDYSGAVLDIGIDVSLGKLDKLKKFSKITSKLDDSSHLLGKTQKNIKVEIPPVANNAPGTGRKRVEDMTREERMEHFTKEKGIPKDQLGGSGYPKEHTVVHPDRKSAKDAARQEGQSAPEHHASDVGQDRHYHSTDSSGEKKTGSEKGAHHSYKKKHQ